MRYRWKVSTSVSFSGYLTEVDWCFDWSIPVVEGRFPRAKKSGNHRHRNFSCLHIFFFERDLKAFFWFEPVE